MERQMVTSATRAHHTVRRSVALLLLMVSLTAPAQVSAQQPGDAKGTGAKKGDLKAKPKGDTGDDDGDNGHDHKHDHPTTRRSDHAPPVDLNTQLQHITARVSALRGLPLKQPIKTGLYPREQLRTRLLSELKREITDAQLASESLVFKQLGLLPRKLDYKKTYIDVLTEQLAGFYDPRSRELFILKGIPRALVRATIAHEIVHGVQDQHHNLRQLVAPFKAHENSDFHLARSALVEGDAMIVTYDFTLHEAKQLPRGKVKSVTDSPRLIRFLSTMTLGNSKALTALFGGKDANNQLTGALGRAPRMLRDVLGFPYQFGARFVAMLKQGKTWAAFDQLLYKKRPPLSTEHILHPDRYLKKDDPVLLPFNPSKALPRHSKIYDNVMGELQTFLWLREHLDQRYPQDTPGRSRPDRAAAGWDGDHMLAFLGPDRQVVVVHMSVWENPREAREYHAALREVTERRHTKVRYTASRADNGQAICFTTGPATGQAAKSGERSTYIEQWGDMVLYIENAPRTTGKPEASQPVYRIRQQAWATVKRVPIQDELDRRAKLAALPPPSTVKLPRVKGGKVNPDAK